MVELNLTLAPLNKNNIWGYLELFRDILIDINPSLSKRISKVLDSGVKYRDYMRNRLNTIQEEIDNGRYSKM